MNQADQYLCGTAYHEAGHAVVAWSLGLPVGTISVRADDASGGTQIGSADHLDLIEQIAVAAAGYMAVEVFGQPTYDLAAFSDLNRIRELLEANGITEDDESATLRWKGDQCARDRIVADHAKVIRLAERLVQDGSVEATEFLRLMED
jgi:hypothetical protein